jgi:hypothetical protein
MHAQLLLLRSLRRMHIGGCGRRSGGGTIAAAAACCRCSPGCGLLGGRWLCSGC